MAFHLQASLSSSFTFTKTLPLGMSSHSPFTHSIPRLLSPYKAVPSRTVNLEQRVAELAMKRRRPVFFRWSLPPFSRVFDHRHRCLMLNQLEFLLYKVWTRFFQKTEILRLVAHQTRKALFGPSGPRSKRRQKARGSSGQLWAALAGRRSCSFTFVLGLRGPPCVCVCGCVCV